MSFMACIHAAYIQAANLRNGISIVDGYRTGVGAQFYSRMTCVMHWCDNRVHLGHGMVKHVRRVNRVRR